MTEDEKRLERIRILAGDVQNNQQLRRIIRNARPGLRRHVYNMIVPHLNFIPKPYSLLK